MDTKNKVDLSLIMSILSFCLSIAAFVYGIIKDVHSNKEEIYAYMSNIEPLHFDELTESIIHTTIMDTQQIAIPATFNLTVHNNSSKSISIMDMKLEQVVSDDKNGYLINLDEFITYISYNNIDYEDVTQFLSEPILLESKESAVISFDFYFTLPQNILEFLQNYGKGDIRNMDEFLNILSENNLDIYGNKLKAKYTLDPGESVDVYQVPTFKVEFTTTSGKSYGRYLNPLKRTPFSASRSN